MELIAKNMLHPRELPDKFDIEIKAKAQIDTGDLNIQSVPGDKSISQRAIILNALSDGTGKIKKVLKSRDIYSCIRALSQLGVPIRWEGDTLIVEGVGLNGLIGPENRVYMDNTATSTRIIMSILAGSPLKLGISGNSLLSNRPMKWVTSHLIKMGANITFLEKRHYLPLVIEGRYPLNPVTVEATVASAQEKSAVLFAGMFADGYTKYKQFCQSRDHTERMMKYFGLSLESQGNITQICGMKSYSAKDIEVPGDISSAAFLLTAYLIRKDKIKSNITLNKIGINKTRIGYINQLKKMGGKIEFKNIGELSGEPVADIVCTQTDTLDSIEVDDIEEVQSFIDEIPLLAIAAAYANGTTILKECSELKDKDTNRIETVAQVLRRFGADVETSSSKIVVHGGSECISVSYPNFLGDLSYFADIRVIPC